MSNRTNTGTLVSLGFQLLGETKTESTHKTNPALQGKTSINHYEFTNDKAIIFVAHITDAVSEYVSISINSIYGISELRLDKYNQAVVVMQNKDLSSKELKTVINELITKIDIFINAQKKTYEQDGALKLWNSFMSEMQQSIEYNRIEDKRKEADNENRIIAMNI